MRLAAALSSELLGPEGAAQFAWSPAGDLLAVAAARKKKVVLFDATGAEVTSLTVPDPAAEFLYDEAAETPVAALAWHPSGSHLAVLPRGQTFAMVWSPTGGTARVDSGVKAEEVSALAWSPSPAPALALGTTRGSGLIWDLSTRAATPLALGRAGKPVCCMAWSGGGAPGGLLALGCKGGLLLLCRAADGGLARSVQLKGAVGQLQFCEAGAGSGRSSPDDRAAPPAAPAGALLAATVGRRSVCIWQLPQALAGDGTAAGGGPAAAGSGGAFELSFREGYGEVEAFAWVTPRLLAAGFSSGQVVAVSLSGGLAPGSGAGTQLFSARVLTTAVAALAWCPAAEVLAVGGGSQVALLACRSGGAQVEQDGPATSVDVEAGARLSALQFSPDGKLLTAASSGGRVLQLLARPPHLHGAWGARVAYVDPSACASEALLLDVERGSAPVALPLPADPDRLALGPAHLAVAQGSRVWYQAVDPDPATGRLPAPAEAEYPTPAITALALGPACALLLGEGGRVFVHAAPTQGGPVVELRGDDGEPFAAGAAALTPHFIVLGLPDGTLAFYDAASQGLAAEFAHGGGAITALFPSADGTLVLFQDASGGTYLYDAARGELMAPPDFAGQLAAAAWDAADPRVLAAVNAAGLVHVYLLVPASVQGPGVKLVCTQAGPRPGAAPLALRAGLLTWHLPDGPLHAQLLDSHRHLAEEVAGSGSLAQRRSRSGSGKWAQQVAAAAAAAATAGAGMARAELLAERCQQALAVCHFDRALAAAQQLGDAGLLREVAVAALQFLEVPAAMAAYEVAGDSEALEQLRPLAGLEDGNLLAGRVVALTGGDPDRAEALLLASSCPSAAVEMRRGLGHWERALALAQQLEPHAVGGLALLRAQALEAEGQAEAALASYQQALEAPDLSPSSGVEGAAERRALCGAGLARCSILAGDVERGVELAAAAGAPGLLLQCAELLEAQGQAKQAGQLYARAGEHERAARLFLACREFGLLDGVVAAAGSPTLWVQYAQAKEDLGSFADAARAYEAAGDAPAAARVFLQRLHDAQGAADVAARTRNAEAAAAVARHCEHGGPGLQQLAVEQYCLAGDRTAAFALAKRAGLVPAFAAWARQARDAEAAQLAAEHLEAQGQLAAAAELCAVAGRPERAARLYLRAGGDGLPAAIKLAQEAGDPAAAAVVVEHLQAVDAAGAALLDLHLALGNAEEASAVALARAQQEQAAGNYKAARDQLLGACRELQARGLGASGALLGALRTLHAYLLVRVLVRQGDHEGAARLLLLVADRIAAFPRHVVPILTSTVIECHRAGLHGPAQRWAAALQAPQYAGQVSPAYARKIEAIARQPAWAAEAAAAAEPQCDCVFCGAPGPEASLACAACQRGLPFCAASARRIALGDWSACPSCNFPCRGRDLTRYASVERACPLCEAPLAVHDVKRIFDPLSHLRRTAFAGLVAGSRKGA